MELITEGNISNKIGDKIIKFFNKHSNLQESPLPKLTKSEKDYFNQINLPAIDFKEKTIATHSGPNFSHENRSERSFREPYECNWWLETEKTLPPLNNLLLIILYSDVITLDGLGKSSGHPVFLTLGNLLNRIQNSPELKVLLGFLPKPDSLHFRIKGRVKIFAVRILFFLADMLEADEITTTFKLANCKMPCHTFYDAVHLNNGQILRITEEFHGKEWFSNIAVTPVEDQEQYNLDEGAWYRKVRPFKEPYELALVQWYDIDLTVSELYGCTQLYFTEEYNTIPIGSIN
ncbi:hypothetical protein C1646_768852 [Rhizophagus diaphanus]|nr:hypothetical protein C1646_768852 [Rhizophagus diaphanus] [Rhizophagus sp. MUCL 43196]